MRRLLVANRGEIACRIMRTAHQMGLETVAIYSEADVDALHVQQATMAFCVGPALAAQSYLNADRIIEIAQAHDVDAIHPGYGFLSENAEFARACESHGIVFVGPSASAIEAMGSKSAAKRIMQDAGVPLVPGYHGEDQSDARLRAGAQDIGYPVLLKAVAGGGGKGMRQVDSSADFDTALASARGEALASFGSDDMLVEKYLAQPRHVEVQVFFDQHGEGVYLFERDCSIQRRHQKILEEAPAPDLSPELRAAMGQAAVQAGHAIAYQGAGTVEFLLDGDAFYFMEMNTRLQVEHPVTEMITGQDLVQWQLRIACGERLPLTQDQLEMNGCAIEVRVYAEDAFNDFVPTSGRIKALSEPVQSDVVRLDTGVRAGDEITPYYDPMIAKLIVWAETRPQALRRLQQALSEYHIEGLTTNLEFLYRLSASTPLMQAQLDTRFIERHQDALLAPLSTTIDVHWPCYAAMYLSLQAHRSNYESSNDPWDVKTTWRMNHTGHTAILFEAGEQLFKARIESLMNDEFRVLIMQDDKLALTHTMVAKLCEKGLTIQDAQGRREIPITRQADHCVLHLNDSTVRFCMSDPQWKSDSALEQEAAFIAPMNGNVVVLNVAVGQTVQAGDILLVIEAMKMQHAIKAPADGVVEALFCTVGELVDGGSLLLDFSAAEEAK